MAKKRKKSSTATRKISSNTTRKKLPATSRKANPSSTRPSLPVLAQKALAARYQAHAPYSGYQIGAALRMDDGRIFTGCNVENASYGGTVCAERVAIFKAISEGARAPLKEIWVASEARTPWPPCGLCRQVIAEFADETTQIHTINPRGDVRSFTFSELQPEAFTPKYLRR